MKRALGQAAALVAMSALAGALTFIAHPRAPALYLYDEPAGPGEITLADAQALAREGGVLWIDARVRAEFEKEHIPGAHLLNEAEWESLAFEMVDTLSSNQRPIVIYCDTQQCDQAHRIAERLRDLGNQEIHVLKGGWQAWKNRAE